MRKGLYKSILLLLGISLITMSLISYEILLTRLFSTILVYHFAFLITSLAILGLGIGGMLAYKNKQLPQILANNSILLPISYLVIVLSIYMLPFLTNIAIYGILAMIPFIIAGVIISTIFQRNPQISNRIYFADLIGSALGSLVILYLLNGRGFIYSLFMVAFIGLMGGLFLLNLKVNIRTALQLTVLVIVGAILFQGGLIGYIENNFTAYYSSPNTVFSRINKSMIKSIDFIGWNAMARTDVIVPYNSRERIIISDGGASAPMISFNGNLEEVDYLKGDIGFLPFSFGRNEDNLIIGSGGGRDVLYSLLGGGKRIDAVEINPLTIQAVEKHRDFNGGIYDVPGVRLFIEDGRSFIEKTSNEAYDNIYLSLVMANAVEYSALSMSEGYVFTQEALDKYLNLLKEDGKLSFVMHSNNDLLRGLNTVIKGLLSRGVDRSDLLDYFVIINGGQLDGGHGGDIHNPVLIVKKTPFTEEEYESIRGVLQSTKGIIHLSTTSILSDYIAFSKGELEYNELINRYSINVRPITDQNPFFYNFFRWGSSTLKVLLIVSLLALFIIIKNIKEAEAKKNTAYFILLGIAFMLVEIPLIQKSVLFIGNPTNSFSYVLLVLLISGGLGSLFSGLGLWQRFVKNKYLPLFLAGLLIFTQSMIYRAAIMLFLDSALIIKLFIMFLIISPLGFFMGMPFPRGIRILGKGGKAEYIPMMWGVNGVASVLGAALAFTLSMQWGFYASEGLGAILYIVLFVLEVIETREVSEG